MEKDKISITDIKKINPSELLKLINKAKLFLESNEVWIDICKDHEVSPNIINIIPMTFGKIDVSAKTYKGVIILNYKLLQDGDFFEDYSYIIHESTHWLQQIFNDKPTEGSSDGDYLDNPYEVEGFQNQVEYISDQFGDLAADEYVDELLDYHEIEGKEFEDKKDELSSKIED